MQYENNVCKLFTRWFISNSILYPRNEVIDVKENYTKTNSYKYRVAKISGYPVNIVLSFLFETYLHNITLS